MHRAWPRLVLLWLVGTTCGSRCFSYPTAFLVTVFAGAVGVSTHVRGQGVTRGLLCYARIRLMQLSVVAYPPYRAGLGAGTLQLELPHGAKLRDVLRLLARRSQEFEPLAAAHGDEWLWGQLLVHVRGEMVRLDDALHDGDCLELLPPIAGG